MTTKTRDALVLDALCRSTADLSDEEIEAECSEDGEDTQVAAERVRGILLGAVAEHQSREREKMRREREKGLLQLSTFREQLPSTPAKRRQLLRSTLRRRPEIGREITAQFRNLAEMTDEDIESALMQLVFLGLLRGDGE